MGEQADRETLARIIMNSLRGSGGIAPNSYTEWTDWRPEADAILASDWLAEVKRAEREAGAREALLNAADEVAVVGFPSLVYAMPRKYGQPRPVGGATRCDNCGKFASRLHPIWCNPPSGGIDREVCDGCADRAAALGTGEEGQG